MGKELSSATEPPRKRRFGWGKLFLLMLVVLLSAGGVAVWLVLSEPDGWKEVTRLVGQVPADQQALLGENLQKQFFNALQGIDSKSGIDVQTINVADLDAVRDVKLSIPVREANLWLMTQLPQLLKNQNRAMPNGIADPRVWIEGKQLVLSCRVNLAGIKGIVSFGLETKLQEDGKLAMKVGRVQTGKLRVPSGVVASAVRDEFKKAKDEVVQRLGDAFDGTTFDPVFQDPADPNRQSRIIGFEIHPDRLDLTLRNGPRKPAPQPATDNKPVTTDASR